MTNDELFIIKLNIAPFFVVNVKLQRQAVDDLLCWRKTGASFHGRVFLEARQALLMEFSESRKTL